MRERFRAKQSDSVERELCEEYARSMRSEAKRIDTI